MTAIAILSSIIVKNKESDEIGESNGVLGFGTPFDLTSSDCIIHILRFVILMIIYQGKHSLDFIFYYLSLPFFEVRARFLLSILARSFLKSLI